jgi:hypothetical protein
MLMVYHYKMSSGVSRKSLFQHHQLEEFEPDPSGYGSPYTFGGSILRSSLLRHRLPSWLPEKLLSPSSKGRFFTSNTAALSCWSY